MDIDFHAFYVKQFSMSDIKDMEIADISAWVAEDNGLFCLGQYIAWTPGDEGVVLDAHFTLAELRAIVAHIEKASK